MEESGLLRVEPKEPTEVPAVLTLVKKDCEGEACRRELEEELDLAHRMPYFSVLGILKYGIGWRPQNAAFENCSI